MTIPYIDSLLKSGVLRCNEDGMVEVETPFTSMAVMCKANGRWQIAADYGTVTVNGGERLTTPMEWWQTPNPYGRWKLRYNWRTLDKEDVVRVGEEDQIAFRI